MLPKALKNYYARLDAKNKDFIDHIHQGDEEVTYIPGDALYLHETIIALTRNLAHNITLKTLKFNLPVVRILKQGYLFTDQGYFLKLADVVAIADALEENKTLENLELRGNHIDDQGVIALTDALKKNTALTFLDLSGNKITDAGATALFKALAINQNITLDLSNNYISAAMLTLLHDTYPERVKSELPKTSVTKKDVLATQINELELEKVQEPEKENFLGIDILIWIIGVLGNTPASEPEARKSSATTSPVTTQLNTTRTSKEEPSGSPVLKASGDSSSSIHNRQS